MSATTACLEPSSVSCGDGTVCRVGTDCASVTLFDGTAESRCVAPEATRACDDKDDLALCDDAGTKRCYGGVCLDAGCGNRLRDPGEVCDDGNQFPGDMCSADCLSVEVCRNGQLDRVTGELCDDGNSLGHDGCSATCQLEVPHWLDLQTTPVDRFAASMVYDPVRQVVVLFGGYSRLTGESSTQTWEWNGRRWDLIQTDISPTSQYFPTMAWDGVHKRVALLGGPVPGEIWEWDGTQWTALAPPGPAPMSIETAVYDPIRKALAVAGGREVWTFDGSTWQLLASNLPLYETSLGFDPKRGTLVLHGTYDPDGDAQVWELVGTAFQRVIPASTATPMVAEDPHFVWYAGQQQLLLVDHTGHGSLWNGSDWTAFPDAPVTGDGMFVGTPNTGGLLALDPRSGTYLEAAEVWTQPAFDPPAPRTAAAGAVDIANSRVFFIGGLGPSGMVSDSWVWDGLWTQLTMVDAPQPRRDAGAAYDLRTDRLVVFGGTDNVVPFGDTFTFDGQWHLIVSATAPSARDRAGLVFDEARGVTLLFGGCINAIGTNDTWTFDGAQWTKQSPTTSPPPTCNVGLAYDPLRQRVVMFGGESAAGRRDDTWEWDGTNWTQIQPVGGVHPPGRAGQLAWNAERQRVTLYSGDTLLDDVWEYDGSTSTWTRVGMVEPLAGAYDAVFVTNPIGPGVLAYGGNNSNGVAGGLHVLRWDGALAETCTSTDDNDGDSLVGCADPDCWRICSPRYPPGTTPPADRTDQRCGDGVCSPLRESCVTCPDDCACGSRCGDTQCGANETISSCPGDCS